MFGTRAKRVDAAGYAAVSKGTGYITRQVQWDGEYRLQLDGGFECLLLVEDEVMTDANDHLLGAKTSLGTYYLAV